MSIQLNNTIHIQCKQKKRKCSVHICKSKKVCTFYLKKVNKSLHTFIHIKANNNIDKVFHTMFALTEGHFHIIMSFFLLFLFNKLS